MATLGRKPGSLVRARCYVCGTVELSTWTSHYWRCNPCRVAGIRTSSPIRRYNCTGKDICRAEIHLAIRDGKLPHPKGLTCAGCGGVAVEYEHRNYNHPMRVEPICRSCNLKRGPAIPRAGSVAAAVAQGFVPYRRRSSAEKLYRSLGLDVDQLAAFPVQLRIEHWAQIAPQIERAIPNEPEITHG
jgi:hypothetical protein